jgi:hypothetical protein
MFFSFPKEGVTRKLWVNACCRADNFNVNTARICSRHFEKECYERNLRHELLNYTPKHGRTLKFDAVPSLFLP